MRKEIKKVYGKNTVYINNEKIEISENAAKILRTNFSSSWIYDEIDDCTYFTLADYTKNKTAREVIEVADRCSIIEFNKELNGHNIKWFACILDENAIFVYAKADNGKEFSYEKEKAKAGYKMIVG